MKASLVIKSLELICGKRQSSLNYLHIIKKEKIFKFISINVFNEFFAVELQFLLKIV